MHVSEDSDTAHPSDAEDQISWFVMKHRLADLTQAIELDSNNIRVDTGGGSGFIRRGMVSTNGLRQTVALKVFKLPEHTGKEPDSSNEIVSQAILWNRVQDHPNILPFLGVSSGCDNSVSLVSPWLPNGNAVDYIHTHSVGAQKRIAIVLDVCRALTYMHSFSPPIIHGDLKAGNVLIDSDGHARLSVFGAASCGNSNGHGTDAQLPLEDQMALRSGFVVKSPRWTSRELMEDSDGQTPRTFESDVFAFGCLAYEILTGHVPFYEVSDVAAVVKISKGARPTKPVSFDPMYRSCSRLLWEVLCLCWEMKPQNRPSSAFVLERLERAFDQLTTDSVRPAPAMSSKSVVGDNVNRVVSDENYSPGGLYSVPYSDSLQDLNNIETATKRPKIAASSSGFEELLQVVGSDARGTNDPTQRLIKSFHLRDLTESITFERKSVRHGGFSDVFRGQLTNDCNSLRSVAIKVLRSDHGLELDRIRKRLEREALIWASIRHRNIVPLLGIVMLEGHQCPSFVLPWYENSNAAEYIKKTKPGPERRLDIVRDVCRALEWMHTRSPPLIHADLKAENVLIDMDGIACLTDFGLAKIKADFDGRSGLTTSGQDVDIYSFGGLCYEIFTGKKKKNSCTSTAQPFSQIAIREIGEIPERTEDFDTRFKLSSDRLWQLLTDCWKTKPADRPSAATVLDNLDRIIAEWDSSE